MMKRQNYPALASLGMLALFAAGILMVLLCGSGLYLRLTRRDAQASQQSTCIQYLTTRIRQAPDPDSISLGQLDGCASLQIRQQILDDTYLTQVYCYEGWLMELLHRESGSFSPAQGEKLLPLKALSFQLEDGLLTIFLTDPEGNAQQLFLDLKEGAS